jgi:hypothetical protein
MGERVLVTGSQGWADKVTVRRALSAWWQVSPGSVLVSGGCPRGADTLAEMIWRGLGGEVERHRPDWSQSGLAAGFRRSELMVSLGAEICLAFGMPCVKPKCIRRSPDPGWPFHVTHGTAHCARFAENSGMPVRRFTSILSA